MKTVNLIMSLSIVLSVTMAQVNAQPITSNTHELVTKVAKDYFNGMANGDLELLGQAFDMEYGDVKILDTDPKTQIHSIRRIPFSKFVNAFKGNANKPWTSEILSVDIVDDRMALVKLSLKTKKSHYVDYLTMYKRNGNWRIINKMFVDTKKSK